MAEVVHNAGSEFWRPPISHSAQAEKAASGVCQGCGSEFIVGARYCHVCGGQRASVVPAGSLNRFEDKVTRCLLGVVDDVKGLRPGALVAFVVGFICLLGAIFTGLIFTAATVLDWQAVQVWRIEWLLASVAAFVAGILLKKN
jgi:hypothetical protein